MNSAYFDESAIGASLVPAEDMADTSRATLTLCPPPSARLAAARGDTRGSRLQAHLRPLFRKTSRALLRLADFTQRLGL